MNKNGFFHDVDNSLSYSLVVLVYSKQDPRPLQFNNIYQTAFISKKFICKFKVSLLLKGIKGLSGEKNKKKYQNDVGTKLVIESIVTICAALVCGRKDLFTIHNKTNLFLLYKSPLFVV